MALPHARLNDRMDVKPFQIDPAIIGYGLVAVVLLTVALRERI
jgi:hypothetical protein